MTKAVRPEAASLAAVVAEGVAKMIIDGGLRPGDPLPAEAALGSTFGVSKPVVREGLSQLVGLGLIESRKGSVATVRRLSGKPLAAYFSVAVRQDPEGLRQSVELRRVLEEYVVGVAARQITDEGISALRRCLGQLYVTRDLDAEWTAADFEFHRQILAIANNPTLSRILDALNSALWETISSVRAYYHPHDTLASYTRHADIFGALAERDAEGARGAMRRHFDAIEVALGTIHALDRVGSTDDTARS
jgi:GntR family transcriptional regulator, transcriptional repressor for pyruvate dehydrogenase complex